MWDCQQEDENHCHHSLPWGTQTHICQPEQTSRDICCLPRAKIQNVVGLIWPCDYCFLLLFHMGRNDTVRANLNSIKSVYRAQRGNSQRHEGSGGVFLNRKHFFTEGDWARAHTAQGCCGVSFLGDIQMLSGYGFEQLLLGGPAWAGWEFGENDLHGAIPISALLWFYDMAQENESQLSSKRLLHTVDRALYRIQEMWTHFYKPNTRQLDDHCPVRNSETTALFYIQPACVKWE